MIEVGMRQKDMPYFLQRGLIKITDASAGVNQNIVIQQQAGGTQTCAYTAATP
jgi:hypothetical protein